MDGPDVGCGFLLPSFSYAGVCHLAPPPPPILQDSSKAQCMLGFIKDLFYIYWDVQVIFVFQSIGVVYYIY